MYGLNPAAHTAAIVTTKIKLATPQATHKTTNTLGFTNGSVNMT